MLFRVIIFKNQIKQNLRRSEFIKSGEIDFKIELPEFLL